MIKVAELSELIKRGNDVLVRGEVLSGKTIAACDAVRGAGMNVMLFDQTFNHLSDLKNVVKSSGAESMIIGGNEDTQFVIVVADVEGTEDEDGTVELIRGLTQNRMINGVIIKNLNSIIVTIDSDTKVSNELAELFDTVTEP